MPDDYAGPVTTLERSQRVGASADAVYRWHMRRGAIERLTPPWESVEVLQAGPVEEGSRVVLRVGGGPIHWHWVARHRNVIEGRQFVDEQVTGPFAHWVHAHRFADEPDGASRVQDRVEFAPPLGPVGALGNAALRRRTERLLRYRHEVLRDEFAAGDPAPAEPRTIAVTGATGMIGSALLPALTVRGHRVIRLVRSRPRGSDVVWDPSRGLLDADRLDGVDAVVHLAGENIGEGRWTADRRRRIRESRVDGTTLLARTLARLPRKPAVLVSVSAIGIYGDAGDAELTETAPCADDFLGTTGQAWEAAADDARAAGIRVVHPRFGMVLSPAGGALGRLLLPARLGVAGPVGTGAQWWSWVAIDDVIGAIIHALDTPSLDGPVNVAAPGTMPNRQFMRTLGRVLHRPAVLPAPAPLLRLAFGEMADALLLASQRVVPARLDASGYRFRYPDLEGALRHVLGVRG